VKSITPLGPHQVNVIIILRRGRNDGTVASLVEAGNSRSEVVFPAAILGITYFAVDSLRK
jgi:hypothetical protein